MNLDDHGATIRRAHTSNRKGTLMRRIAALVASIALGATVAGAALADYASLQVGSAGDEVAEAQRALIDLGFLEGDADGVFGPMTESAVSAFQADKGLEATGIIDKETHDALSASGGKTGQPGGSSDGKAQQQGSSSKASSVITVENDPEFAAIMGPIDTTDPRISAFVKKNKGKTVEFDGNIQYLSRHGSYKTRYDYLIGAGDFSFDHVWGPAFQISDASLLDMHWKGDVPDSVGIGTNIHIVATIKSYDSKSGLLTIKPVSISIRD